MAREAADRGVNWARFAAIAGLIAAVAIVGFLMFGGRDGYTVKARFQNAGQPCKG